MQISKDLIAASAIPLILSILEEKDNYGYSIIKKVKKLSNNKIEWTEGMLYPVLHRLEKQEAIESYWKVSETGRKRKYYSIKKKGNEILKEQKTQWQIVNNALQNSWKLNLKNN
jgi:DNA-binding PadR family transcriptional regulator